MSDTAIPLSFTQEFLCMFGDGGETGPFGPRYHGVRGWRLRGALKVDALRGALEDVAARHEALHTAIVQEGDERYQEILPPAAPELTIEEVTAVDPIDRDRRAEEFVNEIESGELSVRTIPHLRAVLGRFDEDDSVLVLVAHHVAIDGWSMQLIMQDIAASYAARSGDGCPWLGEVTQYREYAVWQKASLADGPTDEVREYWRDKLRDARMLGISADRRQPAGGDDRVTSVHRFLIDADLTDATQKLARKMRGSPFMILLAAYQVLLHGLTGADDVVVPTISFGRGHARFENTVGPFFNFLPLRTDLAECKTLRDVVSATRTTCMEAQTNEVPFAFIMAEAPDLMSTFADESLAVAAFQVFQYSGANGGETGNLKYAEIRRRLLSQPQGSDIPDGALWTLEIDPDVGEMYGNLRYNTGEFDDGTIETMVHEFQRALRKVVTAPDSAL
ncbi:MAG: Non-ribosomal peptide synthetase-like protein [Actinophytocola sp.]|uniref:condensation domain-containing protein n=1 Tax=Actinophytocola sp. TaxID=1872138 RepID=UPI0013243848|nr:condensation domain-containing protein [Actinophytocola sp.]MPZ81295.1 Non-ribosomal peptide synthetase-like protein [Actinophytocola sp.]